jgi:hypothetical protein
LASIGATAWDSVGVVRLYLLPCNTSDPHQLWDFPGAAGGSPAPLTNVGTGACVDAGAQFDPGMLTPCNASSPAQAWARDPASGHVVSTSPQHCLDVYMFTGPDVEMGSCKAPGNNDANQVWAFAPVPGAGGAGTLSPNSTTGLCLAASSGPAGGRLVTTDATGKEWCLDGGWSSEGGWSGAPCSTSAGGGGRAQLFVVANGTAPGTVTITGNPAPGPNNQFGASGPVPHSRYLVGYGWEGMTSSTWLADGVALGAGAPSPLQATATNLYDDDLVGNVTVGGAFCLDVTTMGLLETWAGPLTGGRIAVALFNRSPADDVVTAAWPAIGAPSPATAYAVRDIWAAADRGTFTGSYSATVPAHGTAFLVLTPA